MFMDGRGGPNRDCSGQAHFNENQCGIQNGGKQGPIGELSSKARFTIRRESLSLLASLLSVTEGRRDGRDGETEGRTGRTKRFLESPNRN